MAEKVVRRRKRRKPIAVGKLGTWPEFTGHVIYNRRDDKPIRKK